jgi:hypothetical protein
MHIKYPILQNRKIAEIKLCLVARDLNLRAVEVVEVCLGAHVTVLAEYHVINAT